LNQREKVARLLKAQTNRRQNLFHHGDTESRRKAKRKTFSPQSRRAAEKGFESKGKIARPIKPKQAKVKIKFSKHPDEGFTLRL
jgi:hypothetical protein